MALGAETTIIEGQSYAVEILASATAANGAPSGTAGVAINQFGRFGKIPDSIRVGVISTAGSGTMTVTLRSWLRLGSLGWVTGKALNASTAAPHTAVAIPETGTDTIGYTEPVDIVAGADRIYLEIVAIAGTATAVTGYAVIDK